ncbi:hypothetical protein [Pelomonas sp. KK5]|uniref:hypothetical protein n=1 Tax=Pelomonas sp. KK5 TaxID=1855730 RepID=UPI00097BFC95|nr:hypothetical protein [Pelomonas sp. KK5]
MSTPYPIGTAATIASAHLAAVRERTRASTLQQRFALAGVLLAVVMVVVLYQILTNNIAQLENRRQARQQQERDRHACMMQTGRLERDQCLAALVQAAPLPPPAAGMTEATLAGR